MKNTRPKISVDLLLSFARLKLNMAFFQIKSVFGWKRKTAKPETLLASCGTSTKPLQNSELIIFAGVPFDDVGGGQRSAQIARCALKSGRRVFYIYAYPRFDVSNGTPVESEVNIPLLTHSDLATLTPSMLFSAVSINATILFELPHPLFMPFLLFARQRGLRTVYELIDDWDSSLGGVWYNQDVHRQFVAQADIVSGTAKVLQDTLRRFGRNDALYLPNAANERIFNKYKCYPQPTEYAEYSRYRCRFVYFGSLYGEWFGWDYLLQAAEGNPDSGFFLIGDCSGGKSLPSNIHLLGSRQIDELPPYLAHADAALLPFIPGKISDAVSPIKIFEYLFMGKQVIATPLPEIVSYPGIVTAADPAAFSALCTGAGLSGLNQKEMDLFIMANSWHARIAAILHPLSTSGNVTAIFLIHNNAGIIERAIESLGFHCQPLLKQILVVDNVSSDGGGDLIHERFPSVTVLRNDVNGCSSGRNLALRHATGEYVAFFDSDQWFTSGSFLLESIAILRNHSAIGAVGWAAGWFDEKRGDLSGPIVDYLPLRGMDSPEAISLGFRTDIAYLGSGGLIMPRAIIQQTEGFDVGYDPTCFEDTDFCFQLKKLGYSIAYRDLTGIQHQPHQTTQARSGSPDFLRRFRANALYFRKKWSGYPDFFVDYPGDYSC